MDKDRDDEYDIIFDSGKWKVNVNGSIFVDSETKDDLDSILAYMGITDKTPDKSDSRFFGYDHLTFYMPSVSKYSIEPYKDGWLVKGNNSFQHAYIEGYVSTNKGPSPTWRTYVDVSDYDSFFIRKSEKSLSESSISEKLYDDVAALIECYVDKDGDGNYDNFCWEDHMRLTNKDYLDGSICQDGKLSEDIMQRFR